MTNIARQFRNGFPEASVIKRTKNSIHLETSPGHFIAEIHSGPIHFGPNADQEIDTTWIADSGVYQHQMALADYKAQAKAAFNGAPLVRYEHIASGQWVTLQPRQLDYSNDRNDVQAISAVQAVTATVNDDTLLWAGAYGAGRDFKWQASTDLLAKELILQTSAAAPTPSAQVLGGANPIMRLAYTFAFSSGISPFVNGVAWNRTSDVTTAGAIEFRDANGNVLWRFAVPQVRDAAGNVPTGVVQRLSKSGPNLLCEVRVPWSWLQSAVYPVAIDPTLTLQPDATAGKDTSIIPSAPTVNNGANSPLRMDGNASNPERMLTQWDVSSIPATATITGVTQSHLVTGGGTVARTVNLYAIAVGNHGWPEGVNVFATPGAGIDGCTWNLFNHNGSVSWAGSAGLSTAGTDYVDTVLATASPNGAAPGWYDWVGGLDYIAEVQRWIEDANDNHGIVHIGVGSNNDAFPSMHSSDAVTAANRPKLVVVYTTLPAAPSNLSVALL